MSLLVFDNVDLEFDVGRLDRHKLDMLFIEPPPEPPTKKVTIWGGVEEDYLMYDDPTYIKLTNEYNRRIFAQERILFESVISYDKSKALTLVDEHLLRLTNNVLVILLTEDDMIRLYAEVLYNSTVTQLGMSNAANMYNVRKYDERVDNVRLPPSDITYSQQFRDMNIAIELGYTWSEFCAMSGQEQSNLVMYQALSAILNYLDKKD